MKYRKKATIEAFQIRADDRWPEWLTLEVNDDGYWLKDDYNGLTAVAVGDWVMWDGKELVIMGDLGFRDQYEEATNG